MHGKSTQFGRHQLVSAGALLLALGATAGEADLNRLTGTYQAEDGRLLIVWDVVDQMPGGRHQLVATEPESGWVRSLHPDSEDPLRYHAGPAWFVAEPRESSLVFEAGGEAGATALRWSRGNRTLIARRAPIRRREFVVESDGVSLAAELVVPPEGQAEAPYPALLMIPGFGPLTRNTPRYVADQFAMAGVAVLIHDKRGTGESGGSYTPAAVPEFATDAAAALAALRARPEVDAERVGVMASSLGGMTAALLYERDPDWAFFVCRVCPTLAHWEAKLASIPQQGRAAELPAGEILDALARQVLADRYALTREDYEALAVVESSTADDGWRQKIGHPSDWAPILPAEAPGWDGYAAVMKADPNELYGRIEAPLLVILGEYDDRLPGQYHASRLRWTLERAGHGDHDIRVLPRASHGLMELDYDDEGRPRPFRRFVPGWHGDMVAWVVERVGASR